MSGLDGQPDLSDTSLEVAGIRAATTFVVGGRWRRLVAMAVTAFAGGVAEALFLVTVTRAAFAVTDGDDRVGIVGGWYLSVESTLLVALGLVLARLVLA